MYSYLQKHVVKQKKEWIAIRNVAAFAYGVLFYAEGAWEETAFLLEGAWEETAFLLEGAWEETAFNTSLGSKGEEKTGWLRKT